MNGQIQNLKEASESESDFDIYNNSYDSGIGQNYSSSQRNSNSQNNENKLKPNNSSKNNNSEVVISKNGVDDGNQLSRLFKRPSLSMKLQCEMKKKGDIDNKNFRNKIQSYFVHK